MVTNNFKKIQNCFLISSTAGSVPFAYPLVNTDGNTVNFNFHYGSRGEDGFPYSIVSQAPTTYCGRYFRFGSGTTPANATDYNLETPITDSSLTRTVSIVSDYSNNTYSLECTFTLTNTTSSDITISEIGYFIKIFYSNQSSNNYLIERTVFDPITIPAGEMAMIKYTVTGVLNE